MSGMEWYDGKFRISDDKSLISVDRVCELLADTYGEAPRARECNELAVMNSVCYGIYHKGEQIGYARVVTDFATIYWICDLVIDEKYRGKGLGKKMVECIVDFYGDKCELGLLGTRDAHGLYEKYGFMKNQEIFMYRPGKVKI